MMNGKWDQNFLFPGGSVTRNLSTSSSPMSTLSSNYKGTDSSFTTDTTTTFMSGAGKMDASNCIGENVEGIICLYLLSFFLLVGITRQDMIVGGLNKTDVIMRKRSENRYYTDENIRDSIVMGDVSSKFPDLGRL